MSNAKKKLLSGLRILLVEDSLLLAMEVEQTLETYGAEVVTCLGASEGMAAIRNTQFDFLLTDYGLGGTSVLPLLHLAASRNIPLAILTGYPPDHLMEASRGLKVFEKPFREADIVKHIAAVRLREGEAENDPPAE